MRIQSSFDQAAGNEEHFPTTIDPRIYHVKLIREHLGDLAGRRVPDAGRRKRPVARAFPEQEPPAKKWGRNITAAKPSCIPPGILTPASAIPHVLFEGPFVDA